MMEDTYTPVPWDFREMLQEAMQNHNNSTIHFFDPKDQVESMNGEIREVYEIAGKGEFIRMQSGEEVRIDKIITLYGKPGPAYEKYDSFANACLDCMGGFDHL